MVFNSKRKVYFFLLDEYSIPTGTFNDMAELQMQYNSILQKKDSPKCGTTSGTTICSDDKPCEFQPNPIIISLRDKTNRFGLHTWPMLILQKFYHCGKSYAMHA